jgi:hypothetical protein
MNALIHHLRTLLLYGLACSAMAETIPDTTTVIRNDGEGANRIVVTGNSVQNVTVDCGLPGRADTNVNSVNINGKSLKCETVIVAGRNTHDVRVDTRCDKNNGTNGSSVNVNSVIIR